MKITAAILQTLRQELSNFGRWDWSAIMLSFIVAALMWLFNALSKNYTTVLDVPVKFRINAPNVVSLEPLPERLRVYISGTGWGLLKTFFREEIPTTVFDIQNPLQTSFIVTRRLIPQLSDNLSGAKIERCEQDTIRFRFEPIQEYELSLPFGYEHIQLAEGHRFVRPPKVNPRRIKIHGPPSNLKKATRLIRYEFTKIGIAGNFSDVVRISFPPSSLITSDLNQVHISFETAYFIRKERQVALEFQNFPMDSSATVQPTTAKVVYYTLPSYEAVTDTAEVRIWLDWRKINWKDSTLAPDLITTEDFFEPQVVPPFFKINYAKGRNNRRNR
ncbi:hypothetical protein [Rhodoflexus sp.]